MQQDEAERVKTTVVKPIVFGNISRYLGKKREVDGRTHLWTAFLRPLDPREDMSVYIRRVQFKLHDSYPNPIRIFHRPPYEVTETGWGEFDIVIKVTFVDQNVKPLVITHLLKLFHCDHDIMMGQKSLVREIYDEMIFVDPPPTFYRTLVSPPRGDSSRLPPFNHETDFNEAKQQALARIEDLNKKVTDAITAYREQLILKKDIVEEAKILADEIEASSMGSLN
ncbi:unnamed protein product [Hydatigera taeniaeformis]|uniref:YEATS domain-containing protein 4 n=1 Tax=Hydatigena taeniaeformis TaxID=6205 RepID=A0A0R3WIN5_HYDTA|nr:unnamed protein product [Hydatigera taeniaeformis]